MAITKISSTRNGLQALRYVTGKSHNKNVDKRVLCASTINCDLGLVDIEMASRWKKYKTFKNDRVEAYRVIQSFSTDELDPDKPEDVKKANQIGQELAKRLYSNSQVVIVTQADGKGHKLHNHIIVNAITNDGKALRGNVRTHSVIAKNNDEICHDFGLNEPQYQFAPRKTIPAQISSREEYSWVDDIANRILQSFQKYPYGFKDENDWKNKLEKDFGVQVNIRGSKRTETGKAYSFAFVDKNGSNRKIRANKLNSIVPGISSDTIARTVEQGIETYSFNLQKTKEKDYYL